MAPAGLPIPGPRDRPASAPLEGPERRGRRFWLAAVLSFALHFLLLAVVVRLATRAAESLTEEPAVMNVRFADLPSALSPAMAGGAEAADDGAPVTEPQPPQESRPEERPPEPPSDEVFARPSMPPEPVPDVPGVGERTPDAPEPSPDDAADEKRRRVDSLLRGLGGSPWVEGAVGGLGQLDGVRDGGDDLQFESKADVDWGPYAARIKRIVRSNWRIPTAAKVGMSGIVTLHFYIARDGSVEELELVRTAGSEPLDVAARDAIALSDALPPPPLPEDLDEDRVGVTWSFLYNVDDAEYKAWQREQRLSRRR